jgi:hypothetical protein
LQNDKLAEDSYFYSGALSVPSPTQDHDTALSNPDSRPTSRRGRFSFERQGTHDSGYSSVEGDSLIDESNDQYAFRPRYYSVEEALSVFCEADWRCVWLCDPEDDPAFAGAEEGVTKRVYIPIEEYVN